MNSVESIAELSEQTEEQLNTLIGSANAKKLRLFFNRRKTSY
jgi:hypothetical protein